MKKEQENSRQTEQNVLLHGDLEQQSPMGTCGKECEEAEGVNKGEEGWAGRQSAELHKSLKKRVICIFLLWGEVKSGHNSNISHVHLYPFFPHQ